MTAKPSYQVLARKYRPQSFDELIGQDVLVKTFKNAFLLNRLAHAFILTGVRGVGKTTTARIIAKSINCIGPDEKKENPDISPCGQCEHCLAIAESRHVDVVEMDAASRTSVDDIREILNTVPYKPVSSRFKVYIIDEVHMLSKQAFNALLKTLEEPPEHVKFIFATTEIRRVPITILSRCQRFDLKRIPYELLAQHLNNIAQKEEYSLEEKAVSLLVKAADGSVRDGLSLLDQGISQCAAEDKKIVSSSIETMLGYVNQSQTLDILTNLLSGELEKCLKQFRDLYHAGADTLLILNDVAELIYYATQLKVLPKEDFLDTISDEDKARIKNIAEKLDMPSLTRLWQMILKGIQEVQSAHNAFHAAEMVFIRMCYLSDQATPVEIIDQIDQNNNNDRLSTSSISDISTETSQRTISEAAEKKTAKSPNTPTKLTSMNDIFALCDEKKEPLLKSEIMRDVHLVDFQPQNIKLRLKKAASKDILTKLSKCLREWTNESWSIQLSEEQGQDTFLEKKEKEKQIIFEKAENNPSVKKILHQFEGAKIITIRDSALSS